MENKPLVSVLLPIYNPKPEWVERSVESALNQTYERIEVIIVNDGSEKSVEQYLGASILENENIRVCSQENQGFTGATNTAIREAKGKYVAPLGQDDIWKRSKIEEQIRAIKDKDIFCFTRAEIIAEDGETITKSPKFPERDFIEELLKRNFIRYETSLIERKSLVENGLLDERYDICSDYELWLRLLDKNNFTYLDSCLLQKRTHKKSGSNNPYDYIDEEKEIVENYAKKRKVDKSFEELWLTHRLRRKSKQIYENGEKEKARELWKTLIKKNKDFRALALLLCSYSPFYKHTTKAYAKIIGATK